MDLYKNYSDEQLVTLLNISDEESFTEIYNRYWDKLYIVAANKLKDCYLAEEIIQDLFLDIWKRRATLKIPNKLGLYLAAALKYKIINANQDTFRKKNILNEINNNKLNHYSLESQLSFEELEDKLDKLVANLPEKCRLIYKLSREEGLSHKKIASHLQISEKTVESHLTRAFKLIRSKIRIFFISFFI
ncbi:MAG: RNA polymerase sigma-70 factor [Arachidicoccus sp.]|nr:RNA polymerase sigma-70 factor [Arachidicoccus sp.]